MFCLGVVCMFFCYGFGISVCCFVYVCMLFFKVLKVFLSVLCWWFGFGFFFGMVFLGFC